MNDDLESMLRRQSNSEVTPQLRDRVLAAVSRELTAQPRRRRFRPLWSVAAAIFIGVGLNIWSFRADVARQADWQRRPTPRVVLEVAEAVGSVTDRQTQERVERQLSASWSRRTQEPIDFDVLLQSIQDPLDTRPLMPESAQPEKKMS